MPNKMELELSQFLNKLDLKADKNHLGNGGKMPTIEENPFYEPYKSSVPNLWKKENDRKKTKMEHIKKKKLLRKPILQRLHSQSQPLGKNWVQLCKKELENEVTWVTYKDIKKNQSKRSYSMSDLKHECEKIGYGELTADGFFVPKRMSEMAESMYS